MQYHPEASPGPHDAEYLFDQFFEMIKKSINKKRSKFKLLLFLLRNIIVLKQFSITYHVLLYLCNLIIQTLKTNHMSIIINVHARQILDSRGNPTVEVDVLLKMV